MDTDRKIRDAVRVEVAADGGGDSRVVVSGHAGPWLDSSGARATAEMLRAHAALAVRLAGEERSSVADLLVGSITARLTSLERQIRSAQAPWQRPDAPAPPAPLTDAERCVCGDTPALHYEGSGPCGLIGCACQRYESAARILAERAKGEAPAPPASAPPAARLRCLECGETPCRHTRQEQPASAPPDPRSGPFPRAPIDAAERGAAARALHDSDDCRARHPTPAGWFCVLAPSHPGDHIAATGAGIRGAILARWPAAPTLPPTTGSDAPPLSPLAAAAIRCPACGESFLPPGAPGSATPAPTPPLPTPNSGTDAAEIGRMLTRPIGSAVEKPAPDEADGLAALYRLETEGNLPPDENLRLIATVRATLEAQAGELRRLVAVEVAAGDLEKARGRATDSAIAHSEARAETAKKRDRIGTQLAALQRAFEDHGLGWAFTASRTPTVVLDAFEGRVRAEGAKERDRLAAEVAECERTIADQRAAIQTYCDEANAAKAEAERLTKALATARAVALLEALDCCQSEYRDDGTAQRVFARITALVTPASAPEPVKETKP